MPVVVASVVVRSCSAVVGVVGVILVAAGSRKGRSGCLVLGWLAVVSAVWLGESLGLAVEVVVVVLAVVVFVVEAAVGRPTLLRCRLQLVVISVRGAMSVRGLP